jgi:hypothetical protein
LWRVQIIKLDFHSVTIVGSKIGQIIWEVQRSYIRQGTPACKDPVFNCGTELNSTAIKFALTLDRTTKTGLTKTSVHQMEDPGLKFWLVKKGVNYKCNYVVNDVTISNTVRILRIEMSLVWIRIWSLQGPSKAMTSCLILRLQSQFELQTLDQAVVRQM